MSQCQSQCTSSCSTPSCVQSCQPSCQQACGSSSNNNNQQQQPIVIVAQAGDNCQSSCSNQCSQQCSTPSCTSSCNNQCSVRLDASNFIYSPFSSLPVAPPPPSPSSCFNRPSPTPTPVRIPAKTPACLLARALPLKFRASQFAKPPAVRHASRLPRLWSHAHKRLMEAAAAAPGTANAATLAARGVKARGARVFVCTYRKPQ